MEVFMVLINSQFTVYVSVLKSFVLYQSLFGVCTEQNVCRLIDNLLMFN
jgi:hypothetical protein